MATWSGVLLGWKEPTPKPTHQPTWWNSHGGDEGFATEGDPEKPLVLFFNPAALEDRK